MADDVMQALVELAEQSYRTSYPRWHGSLWHHVVELTIQQALWRPAAERHCIWEIVRHITIWRRYVIEWHAGRPRPDVDAGNWTLPDPADDAALRADLAALERTQDELVALFRSTNSEALLARNDDGTHGRFVYAVGILQHDSYHTGQIALLRAGLGLPSID